MTVPDGVAALDERRTAAAAAVADAARALAEAEQADTAARAARDPAVPEAPLAQASRDLGDLQDLLADLTTARHARSRHAPRGPTAEAALAAAAEARQDQQRHALEEARRAHVIAGLRPHLVAGRLARCASRPSRHFPRPSPRPEIDDAQARLEEAEQAVAAASPRCSKAAAAKDRAEADLESRLTRRTGLLASLAGALRGPLAGRRFRP